MRRLLRIITVSALAMFIAGSASAGIREYDGEFWLEFGRLPVMSIESSGIATINGSAGGSHLSTIAMVDPILGTDVIAVTDPLVTAGGVISVRLYATGGTGTLSGISDGAPISGILTIRGNAAICLAVNCALALNITFQGTHNGEQIGLGIGGLLTFGGYAGLRVSVEVAPWTIGQRTGWNFVDELTTPTGTMQATSTVMHTGFRHGPSSNTSTTGLKSGVVSFIVPMVIHSEGIAGNSQHMALFSGLVLHFIPEPGMILLIGSGIAGLVVLGRHRMRR